jgi:hypothetical protein
MATRVEFTEESMRKIKSISEAIKIFSAQGIPTRRIVFLYQQSYEVNFGRNSVNMAYLNSLFSEKQKEFLKNLIPNKTVEIQFNKAVDIWKQKFSDKVIVKRSVSKNIIAESESKVIDSEIKDSSTEG